MIEDKVVDFNPGDLLFLYTDGITESTNQEQEEFGIERLSQQIKNYSNLEPKLVNERVVSQVDKFSNLELDRDDLTIFSAKRI